MLRDVKCLFVIPMSPAMGKKRFSNCRAYSHWFKEAYVQR